MIIATLLLDTAAYVSNIKNKTIKYHYLTIAPFLVALQIIVTLSIVLVTVTLKLSKTLQH